MSPANSLLGTTTDPLYALGFIKLPLSLKDQFLQAFNICSPNGLSSEADLFNVVVLAAEDNDLLAEVACMGDGHAAVNVTAGPAALPEDFAVAVSFNGTALPGSPRQLAILYGLFSGFNNSPTSNQMPDRHRWKLHHGRRLPPSWRRPGAMPRRTSYEGLFMHRSRVSGAGMRSVSVSLHSWLANHRGSTYGTLQYRPNASGDLQSTDSSLPRLPRSLWRVSSSRCAMQRPT